MKELQLMLAGTIKNLEDIRFPVMASPKLDGIRATVTGGQLISRNGKPIRNKHVQQMFALSTLNGIDGELICGEETAQDVFRATSSAVMSQDGEPDVKFRVFDIYDDVNAVVRVHRDRTPFQHRLLDAKETIKWRGNPNIKVVQHIIIKNVEELLRYEEVCLAKGYEGVMIRDPNGPYKHGRSTVKEGWLLKLKRFKDSEAIIIGMVELNHNNNEKDASGKRTSHKAGKVGGGILGALLVRDVKTGVEFEIGTGFTRDQRQEFWGDKTIIGKQVTYKFFPTGSKDKPRFPVFKWFREDI